MALELKEGIQWCQTNILHIYTTDSSSIEPPHWERLGDNQCEVKNKSASQDIGEAPPVEDNVREDMMEGRKKNW